MGARRSWVVKIGIVAAAALAGMAIGQVYKGREALAQLQGVDLPHFKCYNFVPAGPPVKEDVVLTDQFGTDASVTVPNRHYLCAPVTKTHGARIFPADAFGKHLVCYHIRPSLGALKTQVVLTDQFRTDSNDPTASGEITTPHLLCAPADKIIRE